MLEFSLDLREEEVRIGGKTYILREMDGTRRDSYNQSMADRTVRTTDGKFAGFKKVTGMTAELLTRCIFDPVEEKYVDSKTVQSWPSGLLEKLEDHALEFNGLNKKADAKAKNDSGESDDSGGE